jgi:hypothetical protein
VCVRATFELTEASSNAHVQCSGCVKGAAVEPTRARSNAAPSARSNVQEYVRTPSEKYFFKKIKTQNAKENIYTNKIFTKTQNKTFTKT